MVRKLSKKTSKSSARQSSRGGSELGGNTGERRNAEGGSVRSANDAIDTASEAASLTEEQMQANIRRDAQGLRDLVDQYQEQHRVMQEEVAGAIIRDVQEQNQLHRLTAKVLREQQAALSNPEYMRWAYENRKGEFAGEHRVVGGSDVESSRKSYEEDNVSGAAGGDDGGGDLREFGSVSEEQRRVNNNTVCTTGQQQERKLVDRVLKDVLETTIGGVGSEAARKRRLALQEEKGAAAADKFDKLVSEENRWMATELRLFNNNNSSSRKSIGTSDSAVAPLPSGQGNVPETVVISLDSLQCRQTLAFIKNKKRRLLFGASLSSVHNIGAENGDGDDHGLVEAEGEDDPDNFPSEEVVGALVGKQNDEEDEGNGSSLAVDAAGGMLPYASKVRLPSGSSMAPPISIYQKATAALRVFFTDLLRDNLFMITNEKGTDERSEKQHFFYVPFLNGSVLWPLDAIRRELEKKKQSTTSSQNSERGFIQRVGRNLMQKLSSAAKSSKGETIHTLVNSALFDECFFSINCDNGKSFFSSSPIERLTRSLVAGDGSGLLRDEGNLLVLVPFVTSAGGDTATPTFDDELEQEVPNFQNNNCGSKEPTTASDFGRSFALCRAFSFKGVTKAIEIASPTDVNPFSSVLSQRLLVSGAKEYETGDTLTTLHYDEEVGLLINDIKQLVHEQVRLCTLCGTATTPDNSQSNSPTATGVMPLPSNVVRTFLVSLAAFSNGADRTERDRKEMENKEQVEKTFVSSSPTAAEAIDGNEALPQRMIVEVDARILCPSVILCNSSAAAFSWTDLCGLARADVKNPTDAVLKMSPLRPFSSPLPPCTSLSVAVAPEEHLVKFTSEDILKKPYDDLTTLVFPALAEHLFLLLKENKEERREVSDVAAQKKETQIESNKQGNNQTISFEGESPPLLTSTAPAEGKLQSAENGAANTKEEPAAYSRGGGGIILTPGLLVGLSIGLGAACACCIAVGYRIAKR